MSYEVEVDRIIVNNPDDKAILVEYCEREIWLPKSQIEEIDGLELTVTDWLAEQEDLV